MESANGGWSTNRKLAVAEKQSDATERKSARGRRPAATLPQEPITQRLPGVTAPASAKLDLAASARTVACSSSRGRWRGMKGKLRHRLHCSTSKNDQAERDCSHFDKSNLPSSSALKNSLNACTKRCNCRIHFSSPSLGCSNPNAGTHVSIAAIKSLRVGNRFSSFPATLRTSIWRNIIPHLANRNGLAD